MSDVADTSLDTIIARLRELAPTIRAEGVTRLAVFGSRVRGELLAPELFSCLAEVQVLDASIRGVSV